MSLVAVKESFILVSGVHTSVPCDDALEHDKALLVKRKWCDGGDGAEPTKLVTAVVTWYSFGDEAVIYFITEQVTVLLKWFVCGLVGNHFTGVLIVNDTWCIAV